MAGLVPVEACRPEARLFERQSYQAFIPAFKEPGG
jgi:hypothetical protein